VRQAFTTFFDFATFDRFPKLKLVLLESGAGWIGYWLDRLDGVSTSTFLGGRAPLKLRPSDYFRRQVWISGDPDERTLPAMMQTYGADRFFWASDYPHPAHHRRLSAGAGGHGRRGARAGTRRPARQQRAAGVRFLRLNCSINLDVGSRHRTMPA